jgi:hypothetical protein
MCRRFAGPLVASNLDDVPCFNQRFYQWLSNPAQKSRAVERLGLWIIGEAS